MTRHWLALCATLVLLGSLAACDVGGGTARTSPTPTPTATITPTPTLGPPTPTNVPDGWKVASGTHFSIAYPSGALRRTFEEGGPGTPEHPRWVYSFVVADGAVVVHEQTGWDAAAIQTQFCQPNARRPITTIAGLPMYAQPREPVTGGFAAPSWAFITNKGVVYLIEINTGTASPATINRIVSTFRMEYPTSGCAH